MTRSSLQNLMLLGAALVVCLISAELFLRLCPKFLSGNSALRLHWRELREDLREQGMTVPDPYLGFRYRPDLTAQVATSQLEFTFRTDEKGFRNPSPWPEHADIVVVGNSMAFGYGVDDEQVWVRLVENELPESKIINLGLIGAGPEQYLRVLEEFGLDLDPKLVLFMLFPGNDLNDAKDFRTWLETRTSVPYKEWQITNGRPNEPGSLRRTLEGSYLFAFVRSLRSSLASPVVATTIEFQGGGRLQLVPQGPYAEAEMAHPGHPVFELAMATIEKARVASAQHGSEFMVLLMPTKEEVYLPLQDEAAPPLVEVFRKALRDREISMLDLTPGFRAEARSAPPLFFEVDGHPNEEGYRLIARLVTEHLRKEAQTYGLTVTNRVQLQLLRRFFAGAALSVPRPHLAGTHPIVGSCPGTEARRAANLHISSVAHAQLNPAQALPSKWEGGSTPRSVRMVGARSTICPCSSWPFAGMPGPRARTKAFGRWLPV